MRHTGGDAHCPDPVPHPRGEWRARVTTAYWTDLTELFEYKVADALAGRVPQVASPLRLSASPVAYRNPPPLLGEHSEALLQRLLGMNDEQIAGLRAAGVI